MSANSDMVKKEDLSPELVNQPQLRLVAPGVDIYENNDEILLHADLPGVEREEMTINLENGRLTLAGRRRVADRGAAIFEEFGEVEYRRTFAVPQGIDIGKVGAELKDGVLRLHLPKSDAVKPRQVEIREG